MLQTAAVQQVVSSSQSNLKLIYKKTCHLLLSLTPKMRIFKPFSKIILFKINPEQQWKWLRSSQKWRNHFAIARLQSQLQFHPLASWLQCSCRCSLEALLTCVTCQIIINYTKTSGSGWEEKSSECSWMSISKTTQSKLCGYIDQYW